jgi:hypothetical protein
LAGRHGDIPTVLGSSASWFWTVDFAQNPAPPDWGAVVAGVVVGLDGEVVGVGALLLPVLLLDPHPAAPTPSMATQAIGAMRRPTFLRAVTLFRFI